MHNRPFNDPALRLLEGSVQLTKKSLVEEIESGRRNYCVIRQKVDEYESYQTALDQLGALR